MRDRSSADDFVVWTDNNMLKKKNQERYIPSVHVHPCSCNHCFTSTNPYFEA